MLPIDRSPTVSTNENEFIGIKQNNYYIGEQFNIIRRTDQGNDEGVTPASETRPNYSPNSGGQSRGIVPEIMCSISHISGDDTTLDDSYSDHKQNFQDIISTMDDISEIQGDTQFKLIASGWCHRQSREYR